MSYYSLKYRVVLLSSLTDIPQGKICVVFDQRGVALQNTVVVGRVDWYLVKNYNIILVSLDLRTDSNMTVLYLW